MGYITQQQKWQKRMIEQGRCRQCGKEKDTDIQMCEICRYKHELLRKKRRLEAQKEKMEG